MATSVKLSCSVICSLLMALIILAASDVSAQSGRRLPKGSPPIAAPAPEPASTPAPKPRPTPEIELKVFAYIMQAGPRLFSNAERMPAWTIERLRRSSLIDVRGGGEGNRRDAIKQAKLETKAYVMHLELQQDPFGGYGGSAARQAWVDLNVYFPVTGKIKLSRRLALGQNSTRLPGSSTVMQACHPGVYGNDLLLLEASIEAADSVMSTFSVPLPPLCSGTVI